jgi:predicted DNA-binding antitoxin AbrB/MazE fold protein
MFSVKGTYENGKIKLLEPIRIKGDTNVIIVFLDDDINFTGKNNRRDQQTSADETEVIKDDHPEEFYEGLRKHKRYKAKGNITLNQDGEELVFPLNDYSAGGLSFFADRMFPLNQDITATLKYAVGDEELVMDFEMTVRGVFEEEEGTFKIGCQFFDQVDEQLWHTIMGD